MWIRSPNKGSWRRSAGTRTRGTAVRGSFPLDGNHLLAQEIQRPRHPRRLSPCGPQPDHSAFRPIERPGAGREDGHAAAVAMRLRQQPGAGPGRRLELPEQPEGVRVRAAHGSIRADAIDLSGWSRRRRAIRRARRRVRAAGKGLCRGRSFARRGCGAPPFAPPRLPGRAGRFRQAALAPRSGTATRVAGVLRQHGLRRGIGRAGAACLGPGSRGGPRGRGPGAPLHPLRRRLWGRLGLGNHRGTGGQQGEEGCKKGVFRNHRLNLYSTNGDSVGHRADHKRK